MIRPGVTIILDRTKAVNAGIAALVGTRVLVGFPEGQGDRGDGSGLNNATLGYIHNFGAPEANIPAREFMVSGIESVQKTIEAWLHKAAQLALSANTGRQAVSGAALSGAGLTAQSGIKGRITSGISPPLKASTVSARRRRSKGSKYRRNATKPAHVTPLIDTGALLAGVTYVIERSGSVAAGKTVAAPAATTIKVAK